MHKSVAIIDYGMGNIHSLHNAFSYLGAKPFVSHDPDEIELADAIVLPGVGAYPAAMKEISRLGLLAYLKQLRISDKPVLGICLGFQLLFSRSEEFGGCDGLGVFSGQVCSLRENSSLSVVPHIGWRELTLPKKFGTDSAFSEFQGESFYFVHSYIARPDDHEIVSSFIQYDGVKICASIESDHVIATQFHPEKSGPIGLKFLNTFLNLRK